MDREVYDALTRLDLVLPLAERQAALPAELAAAHRLILHGLVEQGRMPGDGELRPVLAGRDPATSLARLAREDLIVVDGGGTPVGAYPVTIRETPHRIHTGDHSLFAMCAIDALSIAPVFGREVRIESVCRHTGTAIRVHQRGRSLLSAMPSEDLWTGVRWQAPQFCAAGSLCLEMVFLRDRETARDWAAQWSEPVSLLTLEQGIEFGTTFFQPLVHGRES